MTDDPVNNGFVSALARPERGRRLGATRRTFLRSSFTTAAAVSAATMTNLFGPAKRVAAQTGVIGQYPRRLLTYCPPYNAGDNCQPGCGSSPICTDCCGSDGFFRNDPANGYTLYPGGCGDGDIADGWIWRYNDVCGNCAAIEYRCSDGYVQTDTGPAPFICRHVTECVPLADGQAGNEQPDAAVQTNWQPAGALERAIDNGGSVTIRGWIADGSGRPVNMRVLADNQIVHVGQAGLARPDIASAVRGAGANTGFEVSFPVEPGSYQFCVNALQGAISVTIGCVNLTVGSGQAVSGSGGSTTIGGLPSTDPTPTPASGADPTPTPETDATPTPTVESTPTATASPDADATPSSGPVAVYGAAQVIRRSAATTGFVSGWAATASPGAVVSVEVVVDGAIVAELTPELPRPDVTAAFPDLGTDRGFAGSFDLPEAQTDVCVVVRSADTTAEIGCRTLGAAAEAERDPNPSTGGPTGDGAVSPAADALWGRVDEAVIEGDQVVIRGWALAPNDPQRPVAVRTVVGGLVAEGATGLTHPEATRIHGIDAPCGFELRVPASTGTFDVVVEASSLSGRRPIGAITVVVP